MLDHTQSKVHSILKKYSIIVLITLLASSHIKHAQASVSNSCPYVLMSGQVDGNWRIGLFDIVAQRYSLLTHGGGNERDASWSLDRRRIMFAASYNAGWDLYIHDIATRETRRVTDNPAYDGRPTWSPDGKQIIFESARDGNIELYLASADGSAVQRLTNNRFPDIDPLWTRDGKRFLFTSWRNGARNIYLQNVSADEATLLTTNGDEPQQAALSPDGNELMYVRDSLERRDAVLYNLRLGTAQTVGQNYQGIWPQVTAAAEQVGLAALEPQTAKGAVYPHGQNFVFRSMAAAEGQTALRLRGQWHQPVCGDASPLQHHLTWLPVDALNERRLRAETDPLAEHRLQTIERVVAQQPRLSSAVSDSFDRLRSRMLAESGFDYLGRLNDAWRGLDHPGGELFSWHKAGRAFDALDWFAPDRQRLYLTRQIIGGLTYFRIHILARHQDGSQGQPLRESIWLTEGRLADPELLAHGGRYSAPPSGYFVDFTDLAEFEHWTRIPALTPPDGDWRRSYADMEFWHYERREELSWYAAMQQLYTETQLHRRYSPERLLVHNYTPERLRLVGLPVPPVLASICRPQNSTPYPLWC